MNKTDWLKKEFWKEKLLTVILLIIGLFLPAQGLLGLAQDSADSAASQTDQPKTLTPEEQDLLEKSQHSAKFLEKIKLEIKSSEDDLLNIKRTAEEMQQKLEKSEQKINTLNDQLAVLDQKIQNSKTMIANVETQIYKKQSEIETLEYQIEQAKIAISFQKKMLSEYLQVIFKDREKFNNLSEQNEQINTLKLLLDSENAADNLRSLRYSEILQDEGHKIFEKLDNMLEEQQTNQKLLELKQRTLTIMYSQLNDQKSELEIDQQAKTNLLEQTKGEQSLYQQLLERSQQQQNEVIYQIDTLRKNMVFVQEKMKKLGKNFNPNDYAALLNIQQSSNLEDFLNSAESGAFKPRWPVMPAKGISAYFHDANYAAVFGMQHNAIDIPTNQGTPIKAPADGFVYKTKDNGYGYSYIILAHSGGFMTLYGHVSSILVSEGDKIAAGEIIGLSGGMPGTQGAGIQTTGPHLHFEIIKDGEYVDPLVFLDLAQLRLDSLPEKYLSKALGDSKIRRKPLKVRVKEDNLAVEQKPAAVSN